MSSLKERSHGFGVDDTGDVVPLEDYSDMPVANESIVQGMQNLDEFRRHERMIREDRERALADAALSVAGPYETLAEHTQTQLDLLDAVSDISMYRGGEKGGYKTKDFNKRYGDVAPRVEGGARENHRKLVNKTFPELLKASQLIAAGFDEQDVTDMVNTTRIKLMRQYGGPENENARSKMRARLKRQ